MKAALMKLPGVFSLRLAVLWLPVATVLAQPPPDSAAGQRFVMKQLMPDPLILAAPITEPGQTSKSQPQLSPGMNFGISRIGFTRMPSARASTARQMRREQASGSLT